METVTYQYTDERLPYQPSVVTVSGLGAFKLFYASAPLSPMERHVDSAHVDDAVSAIPLGLTRVLTPSGLRRDFSRLVGLRTHQLRYTPWPGSPAPWIYEWGRDFNHTSTSRRSIDTNAPHSGLELLRFIWPSGYRRITASPEQNQLIYDKTLIQWHLLGMEERGSQLNQIDSAPFVQMSDVSSGYRWNMWRTYRGTLLISARIEQHIPGARNAHPNLGGLLHARHVYTYNQNLNLVGIHTQLYTQSRQTDTEVFGSNMDRVILDEQTVAKYDFITGQLLSIRDLDIVHRASSICITYAPRSLQLCRQLDNQGRLKQVVLYPLSSRRDPLYNLSVIYRANSLEAAQQREEQRGQVPRWINFVHGPGGRLEALDREKAGSSLRSHSVLVHNSEGRLARLRIAVSDPQLHHGSPIGPPSGVDAGPTSRSEELQFVYDARGLLKRRGNWQYTFDDDGFLTERRLQNNRIVDRFAYNSKGLLIWAERKLATDSDNLSGSTAANGAATMSGSNSGPMSSDMFHNLDRSPLEDDIGSRRAFRVQYVYDAQDRLVVVRDTLIVRDLMQYFYADPTHLHRITHVFNHGRLVTFRLHYDPVQGHLFAVEEFARLPDSTSEARSGTTSTGSSEPREAQKTADGNQKHMYFVITNHEGAPTAMFSENGKPSWTAEYSATGSRRLSFPNRNKFFSASILEDANIPIGHAGCLVDVHTGFLFCSPTYRAYDPSGATFVSPDWRRLVSDRLPEVYRDPSVLDTHRWGNLEQQDHDIGPAGLLARVSEAIQYPSWWLNYVGFRLDGVLPQLDSGTGRLNRPSRGGTRATVATRQQWQLPVLPVQFSLTGTSISGGEGTCPAVRLLNNKLERLSVIQPSHLTTGGVQGTGLPDFFLRPLHSGDTGRVQLLPAQTMFDSGVILELTDDQLVQVRASGRADLIDPSGYKNPFESGKLADLLLSGTRLMDWWTVTDTPNSRLFVQSFSRLGFGASSLVDDLTLLGLRLPVYHRPTGHNLTLVPTGGHNEVWLTRGALQWRIRFASSWTEAWDQVAWDAQKRGEQLAWYREALMAQQLDLIDPARYPESAMDRMAESSSATHFLGLNYLWTFKQAYQLARQGQLAGYRWVPVVGQSATTRELLTNGTAWTRLYENPDTYQLFKRLPESVPMARVSYAQLQKRPNEASSALPHHCQPPVARDVCDGA
ncbi:unnamed protein product [Echinostoma caproni]|uniref:Tox-GHH domain-containing protein n=1 Tax=Echinostoma caproni TaxID=27848 RepID=A0A183ATX0_9TREM|nr:unnamed protein product [Echinostoma caproni]